MFHLQARSKIGLFNSLSTNVFDFVFTLKSANEIWLKLHELHGDNYLLGTKEQRSQRRPPTLLKTAHELGGPPAKQLGGKAQNAT